MLFQVVFLLFSFTFSPTLLAGCGPGIDICITPGPAPGTPGGQPTGQPTGPTGVPSNLNDHPGSPTNPTNTNVDPSPEPPTNFNFVGSVPKKLQEKLEAELAKHPEFDKFKEYGIKIDLVDGMYDKGMFIDGKMVRDVGAFTYANPENTSLNAPRADKLRIDKDFAMSLESGNPSMGFIDLNTGEYRPMTLRRFVLHEFHHAVQYHEGFDGGHREGAARNYEDQHANDGALRGENGAIVPNPKSIPPQNSPYTFSKGTSGRIVLAMTESMDELISLDGRFGSSSKGLHIEITTHDKGVRLDAGTGKVTVSMSEGFFDSIIQGGSGKGYVGIDGKTHPLRMNRLVAQLDVYAYMFDDNPSLKAEAIANGGAIPASVQRSAIEFVNSLPNERLGAAWDPNKPQLVEYEYTAEPRCQQYGVTGTGVPLYMCPVPGGF